MAEQQNEHIVQPDLIKIRSLHTSYIIFACPEGHPSFLFIYIFLYLTILSYEIGNTFKC